MSEMVEKVVAALIASSRKESNLAYYGPGGIETPFRNMARAAIAAMREPTKAMENAGRTGDRAISPTATWQAMIDSALKDTL